MGFGARAFRWPRLRLARLRCERVSVVVVVPRVLPFGCWSTPSREAVAAAVVTGIGRAIGLDVHLEFWELAICEGGKVCSAGRVASTPEALKILAEGLLLTDRVALEVTGDHAGAGEDRSVGFKDAGAVVVGGGA